MLLAVGLLLLPPALVSVAGTPADLVGNAAVATVQRCYPDFFVTEPQQGYIIAGEPSNNDFYTVHVKAPNPVLSCEGLPAGVTGWFDYQGNQDNAVKFRVKASCEARPGDYSITIKESSGIAIRECEAPLKIIRGDACCDFDLGTSPDHSTIEQCEAASFTITGIFSGSTGAVDLAYTTDRPLNGTVVTLSRGSIDNDHDTSTLTITTSSKTDIGDYTITVTGRDENGLTKENRVTLTVNGGQGDFSLSAQPTSREIDAGLTAEFTITGSFSGCFEEPVELAVDRERSKLPPGVTFSFYPNNRINDHNDPAILTIGTQKDTPAGTYPICIVGSGGTVGKKEICVDLVVRGGHGDFSIEADPTSRDIEPGGTARFTITVNKGGSLPSYAVEFPDSLDLDELKATIEPSSLPPTSDTNSVTLTVQTDPTVEEGTYTVSVNAKGGGHTASIDVTLVVGKPPVPESAGLAVDKSVSPPSAKVGGVLLYSVRIENTGRGTLKDVVIRDNLPAGVGYVKGSAVTDGKGSSDPSGTTTLIWEIGDLTGGETITLKYHGVVKPNIARGKSTNTVTVTGTDPTGRTLSARDTADVGVSSETLDRKGKIKGRVFIDENGNGLKNVDEEGVAGIWVVLESGERTTTDEEGLFVFDEVDSGEHLVGLHVRKLPKEYYVIGDASKIVSLFSGGTGRTYFALGRTGPSKKELEEMKQAEEEKKKQEEEARKEEEKKEEEEKEKNLPTGTVFGKVFIDDNANEIYNPGEKGAEGVTVLLDADKKTVTDKLGNFRFNKVKEGRHVLSIREDKDFRKSYRLPNKKKISLNVKASTNNRQDIPVSDKKELQINIKLNAR